MSELFIGIMSGTSMDAIDTVLVDFDKQPLSVLHTHSEAIPASLKQSILSLCTPGSDEINRLGQLDVQLGRLFSNACHQLLKKSGIESKTIRAIGSHGQTIRHHPNLDFPFTLQIGDPNVIAARTGITTVADFRRRDMAIGGQGAPLVPAFHQSVFHDDKNNRVVLNIGGIANVTVLPANIKQAITGFDTGPGNTLMDAWAHRHLNKPYDKDGEWARTGKINQSLLDALLNDNYFTKNPPKSTGREHFNLEWLTKHLPQKIADEDVQRTLLELTVVSIINAIEQLEININDVLLCGGGIHNLFLVERLTELGKTYNFQSTENFGIAPDWVEAIAFAWLAKQTLAGKPGNIHSVTGAKDATILGGIYL